MGLTFGESAGGVACVDAGAGSGGGGGGGGSDAETECVSDGWLSTSREDGAGGQDSRKD